jgi:hypothetical protein
MLVEGKKERGYPNQATKNAHRHDSHWDVPFRRMQRVRHREKKRPLSLATFSQKR